jgi:BMFP domain-containing protein YqiC
LDKPEDKPEEAFVERVQHALNSLDVATKHDIDALSKQVTELTNVTNKLSAHLEEAQSAAKATAKKASKDAHAKAADE